LDGVAVEIGDVWLEKIVIRPPSEKEEALPVSLPAQVAEEIRRLVESVGSDDEELAAWMEEFAELRGRLGGELSSGEAAATLSDRQAFRTLVAEAGGRLR
jgi:hypothetical protein